LTVYTNNGRTLMTYVTKENTEDIYALSPTQKGMLFHTVFNESTPVYFEQFSFTVNGPLDIGSFKLAWEHIIESTPVFRTVFKWTKVKEPVQIVLKKLPVDMAVHDISGLDGAAQSQFIREFRAKDKNTPFPMEEGPLLRLNLFKLGAERHHFLWSYHHILIDGWCMPLVMKDLIETFLRATAGQPLVKTSRRPYRDYIAWYLKQDQEKAKAFWKSHLADLTAPTSLPLDRQPGQSAAAGSAEERLELPPDMTSKIQDLCKKLRVTQSTMIQAVWAMLLSRYSRQNDVVFGMTVSGRPADLTGSEDMIGLFINTLPIRVNLTEGITFSELLAQVQTFATALREYEYSFLSDVKACSSIAKSQNLFDSIVVFENYPIDSVVAGSSRFGLSDIQTSEMTNFPLTMIVSPDERIRIDLHYHTALFDGGSVAKMLGHMQEVLSAVVEAPDIKISEVGILTSQELNLMLEDFNQTDGYYSKDKCPYQLFEEQAAKTPDKTAVTFEGKSLTYAELNACANRLANFLRKKGVGPDSKVGLMVGRSYDIIVGVLGIQKAGGAYVPMDPEYPKARIAYMIEDSGSPVIITQQALLSEIEHQPEHVVCIDSDWDVIAKEDGENLKPSSGPENLSHLIYTSGSTGLPKGVMIEHRNVTAFLYWCLEEFRYDEYEDMLFSTSMCFDLSVFEMLLPLITGGRVIVLRSSLDLDEYLSENTATMINTVPSALKHLLSITTKRHRIKAINLAGEPLKLELVREAYEMLDVDIIRNLYGPTEDTTYSTNYRCPRDSKHPPLIGRPISNTKAYIVDQYLKPVPLGVCGEIYLSGHDLARGYWNAPEKTAQRFISNPFHPDFCPVMYKTGDLGKWLPDSNIEFHGRVDYQVKIRGNRIELGEIEARLAGMESITDVAVIDKDDEDGNKYLVAYYVSDEEIPVTDLRAWIKEKLPEYMIPSRFVRLDALPLTPNGKVDRKALPEPDDQRPAGADNYIAPRNEIEAALAKHWEEVLGISRVGIHDNFFELGGHSLLIMKVLARLKFTYPLTVQDFFDYQTVAELANRAAERLQGGAAKTDALLIEEVRTGVAVDIPLSGKRENPRSIVLTGVTGYLGAHLLYELLDKTEARILCLIRGESDDAVHARLEETVGFYFDPARLDLSRVTPVKADLGIDGLGLSTKDEALLKNADTFVHAAADVRHFGDYEHFRNINVKGTDRLLNLARSNARRFNYISTLSIAGDHIPGIAKAVFKEEDYDRGQVLGNVYTRSKFEAEGLVRKEMESIASIYRIGNLVGASDSGRFQRNIDRNAFYGLLKAMAQMGVIPEGIDLEIDLTPVDSCRKALVELMMVPETKGRCMHVFNPKVVRLADLVGHLSSFGYSVRTLGVEAFVNVIKDKDEKSGMEEMMPHLAGTDTAKTIYSYDDSYARYFLDGFAWPATDRDLLQKLLAYCVSTGFMDKPGA
jgi:amino acid adenylation domain-containing protein/thioester reductase-like protein